MELPTFDDVKDAADRLTGHARRTPVLTQTRLDDDVGAEIRLKCETCSVSVPSNSVAHGMQCAN